MQDDEDTGFDYEIVYEIDEKDIKIEWKEEKRFINDKEQKTLGKTPFPDNVIVYYSVHSSIEDDLKRIKYRILNLEEKMKSV